MSPKSNDQCPYKKRMYREEGYMKIQKSTLRRKPCESRGREWSFATLNRGMLELEEAKRDSLPETSEETLPC